MQLTTHADRDASPGEGAATESARFGKFPNSIALHSGLSLEATAYAMRKSIFVGAYGLSDHENARELDMGRDVGRRARRELVDTGIMRRWQPNRRKWAKDQLLIDPEARQYRRVEAAWLGTLPYKELATVGFIRALSRDPRTKVRGASATRVAARFGVKITTASKYLKALVAKGYLRNDGTLAKPCYVWAQEPVPLQNSGGRKVQISGPRTLQKSGRNLTVSLPLNVSSPQGAEHGKANSKPSSIEVTHSPRTASQQPTPQVETLGRCSAVGGAAEVGAPTVSRSLVDRAHALGFMPELWNRLVARAGDKTKDPIRNPDAVFATMIENEKEHRGVGCELVAASKLPKLIRRPRERVEAEDAGRIQHHRLTALDDRAARVKADMVQRMKDRFNPEAETLARARLAALR